MRVPSAGAAERKKKQTLWDQKGEKKPGAPGLLDECYDIIKEEIQAGPLAVPLEAPLNKQAGYHITNIYLTPPQKVLCRPCARGGEPFPNLPTLSDAVNSQNNTH